jgi:adenine C2-methylase RlmN of 23S rRNA A2503 and tRNA A37
MKVIKSAIDESVNFVQERDGILESRYVHRPGADYFVCYLSSHTGCNKACRFCHLTATGQTYMRDATIQELVAQMVPVFEHNAKTDNISAVNINFMARGEPLANMTLLKNWHEFTLVLHGLCKAYGLEYNINISTIMPEEMEDVDLADVFGSEVTLYYSLYSLKPRFRRRYIPKSMDPYAALLKLRDWQQRTGGRVVIHFAMIQDGNDCYGDHHNMLDYLLKIGLDTRLNLVRYNPPDPKKSREAPNWLSLFELWKFEFPESKIVSRVGEDVYASCGMFVNG